MCVVLCCVYTVRIKCGVVKNICKSDQNVVLLHTALYSIQTYIQFDGSALLSKKNNNNNNNMKQGTKNIRTCAQEKQTFTVNGSLVYLLRINNNK